MTYDCAILAGVERTTIFLPPELRRRLSDEAKAQGRPQAEVVRDALEGYLARRRPKLPSMVGMVSIGLDGAEAKRRVRQEWAKDAAEGRVKPRRRRPGDK